MESIERQMAQLCAKIDSEARTLAKNDFPKEARDLFMEQGKSIELTGAHCSVSTASPSLSPFLSMFRASVPKNSSLKITFQ